MHKTTKLVSLSSLTIVATLITLSAATAEDLAPVEIDVWSPPFNAEHQHAKEHYTWLGRAS